MLEVFVRREAVIAEELVEVEGFVVAWIVRSR